MMKNTIKTLTMALCLIAFFAAPAIRAQERGNGERNRERQNELIEKLNLSKGQKAKYIKVQKHYGEKMSQLRGHGKRKGDRKKIKVLKRQKQAEMKTILNDRQYAIYKKETKRKGKRRKA